MKPERDNFDDPEMAELLSRWGNQVGSRADITDPSDPAVPPPRGRELFEPPADRSKLHRALDRVDEELAVQRGPATLLFSQTWWARRGLAAAAAIVLVIGGWWYVHGPPQTPPAIGDRLKFSDSQLSRSVHRLRGAGETDFRSGDDVYLHVTASKPGAAVVAVLDSNLDFVRVTRGVVLQIHVGDNPLGPFELNDPAGKNTIVLIGSELALGFDGFEERLIAAEAVVATEALAHDERLRRIVDALQADDRLTVVAKTYNQLPGL